MRNRKRRPGASIDPTSGMSDRYRERRELVSVIKIVLALLATLAITVAIVVVTKRTVLGPPLEVEEREVGPPSNTPGIGP